MPNLVILNLISVMCTETKSQLFTIAVNQSDPYALPSMREEERVETTFWMDFSIADVFGLDAVQDTYNRAFSAWKNDVKYFTELAIVLNHKIFYWYEKAKDNKESKEFKFAQLYDKLWREADEYAISNFTGDDAQFYYDITD